jgi:hypothetical protein
MTVQLVVDVHLPAAPENPFRYLWGRTENLPRGTLVRVHARSAVPYLAHSCSWHRPDLVIQFCDFTPDVERAWVEWLSAVGPNMEAGPRP